MSELVEKVEKALARTSSDFFSLPADLPEAHLHKAQAVAAIAAVAEWLAQSEDRECYPLQCLHNELEQPK